jgi:hypothetical protein
MPSTSATALRVYKDAPLDQLDTFYDDDLMSLSGKVGDPLSRSDIRRFLGSSFELAEEQGPAGVKGRADPNLMALTPEPRHRSLDAKFAQQASEPPARGAELLMTPRAAGDAPSAGRRGSRSRSGDPSAGGCTARRIRHRRSSRGFGPGALRRPGSRRGRPGGSRRPSRSRRACR